MMKGKEIQETCEFLTLDVSDKSKFTGKIGDQKTLFKLIQNRACEKAHKYGIKLATNLNKWNEMQAYEIFEIC